MEYLNIALPKGRMGSLAVELFEECGLDCSEINDDTRKLILSDEKNKIRFFLVKPSDVPTYVENGAADLGVAGKYVLMEHGAQNVYEPLDLKIANCKLMTAGKVGMVRPKGRLKIATKYVNLTRQYYASLG